MHCYDWHTVPRNALFKSKFIKFIKGANKKYNQQRPRPEPEIESRRALHGQLLNKCSKFRSI